MNPVSRRRRDVVLLLRPDPFAVVKQFVVDCIYWQALHIQHIHSCVSVELDAVLSYRFTASNPSKLRALTVAVVGIVLKARRLASPIVVSSEHRKSQLLVRLITNNAWPPAPRGSFRRRRLRLRRACHEAKRNVAWPRPCSCSCCLVIGRDKVCNEGKRTGVLITKQLVGRLGRDPALVVV